MTVKLAENVFQVGVVDWYVRDFHSYSTKRGSTYNAYLVKGSEATAVIDTVKAPFAAKFIAHVLEHATPDEVKWIVCNHAEPDHSSSFPVFMKAFPNATLVCNAKCHDALQRHYDTADWKFKIITEGETLPLGGRTLQFFDTPMVHWPESMVTYLQEEKILFSMDIFGQHYASSARFDDEADMCEVMQEAKSYYATIVMPFMRPVDAVFKKVQTLDIRMAAPSHGVIWRSHFADIVKAYADWHVCKPTRKVVIVFTTMWHSTQKMAEAIADGAASRGVDVKVMNTTTSNSTDIATEVLDCAALVVGTATLNQGVMPAMGGLLTYLRGLKPLNKTGFAFGSYGWAGKGAEEADRYLRDMSVSIFCDPILHQFVPDAATLQKCRETGAALADKIIGTI